MNTMVFQPVGLPPLAFLRQAHIEGRNGIAALTIEDRRRGEICMKAGYLVRFAPLDPRFYITEKGVAYLERIARAH